jgi:pimeloyl-ACP methyl ester carboxylesterase
MTLIDPQDLDRAAERHGRWFTSAGTRLFFLDLGEGQGPPIVFLQGGLADHRAALVRVGAVAASRRLLLPDLRGSGRSLHAGALSWDQLADDLLALLASQGLDRAVIGGTSTGRRSRPASAHPRRGPLHDGELRPRQRRRHHELPGFGPSTAGERPRARRPRHARPAHAGHRPAAPRGGRRALRPPPPRRHRHRPIRPHLHRSTRWDIAGPVAAVAAY